MTEPDPANNPLTREQWAAIRPDMERLAPIDDETQFIKHPQFATTPKHDDPDGSLADTRGRTTVRSNRPVHGEPVASVGVVWFVSGTIFGAFIMLAGVVVAHFM
jgi:hypothetical protein